MHDKLKKFADWHGIDTQDAGSLLLAATDNNEFTHLDASRFEEMGIKPGDSIEEVTSAIRTRLSEMEAKKDKSEIYDMQLINHVLNLLA